MKSNVSLMTTLPLDSGTVAALLRVTVARGNLYLIRETCEGFLPGVQAVALLDRQDRVLIVPLTPESGGGLLLKIRNARGDRVIHAQEFFREKGYLEDFVERSFPLEWSDELAALVLQNLTKTPKTAN